MATSRRLDRPGLTPYPWHLFTPTIAFHLTYQGEATTILNFVAFPHFSYHRYLARC